MSEQEYFPFEWETVTQKLSSGYLDEIEESKKRWELRDQKKAGNQQN